MCCIKMTEFVCLKFCVCVRNSLNSLQVELTSTRQFSIILFIDSIFSSNYVMHTNMKTHTCELHVKLPAGLLGESITPCCCVPYSITDHFFLALRETNQFTKIRTKQENHTTQLIPLPFSERLPSTSDCEIPCRPVGLPGEPLTGRLHGEHAAGKGSKRPVVE